MKKGQNVRSGVSLMEREPVIRRADTQLAPKQA